ncbi:aminotransferase class V-fold PLP-dependent enzyme [Pigmentibacter sp. JX0631]|uniref:aminotransferase class V-fold PLP-dependent enzyme n=1 Tax=Pigmentibacter sp. JX0631 TaxID=2976982 RepID=UPI002469130D|nr:aminotransferase class V-fold PLP-dependent enzyme [Pigmentibacter sp. JX0631]WGL61218.1 aminotransferase class V-fold PLP-dependent enzyme [Pigmentibacter sp. JX0631]
MSKNQINGNSKVYFDCNATAPILKDACQAALWSMERVYANPSSSHIAGAEAKLILEESRLQASKLLNVKSSEIYFTSGATEAIQISVLSVLNWIKEQSKKDVSFQKKKILISKTEHKAVYNSILHWKKILDLNIEIMQINVDDKGHVNLNEIKEYLNETVFLCTMAVNNETGLITNLKEIEKIIRSSASKVFWLVDCVQALGKLSLNFNELSVDYATFSGHKVHAPKGVGFLYLRDNAPQCSLIVGGGQERGIRAGTENHPGIAAFGVILEKLNKIKDGCIDFHFKSNHELLNYRKLLLNTLMEAFPTIEINTDMENSVATTLNFSVYGFSSKELMRVFDAAGVSLSGGSACNSKSLEYSHVLEAMNLPEWRKASAIRLSFGLTTSQEEIFLGIKNIQAAGKALRNSCLNLTCKISDESENQSENSLIHGITQLEYDSSNTWLISDINTKSCVIIDPTFESIDRLISFIKCKNLELQAVLDTHSHADHLSARSILLEKLSLKDTAFDPLGWNSQTCILNFNSSTWELERFETPGHTLDSVSYFLKNKCSIDEKIECVFIGDTVLIGGLGRTDFSISDNKLFYDTLRNLDNKLHANTVLCPAHDYNQSIVTTWGTEKRNNILLKKLFDPVNLMNEIDFFTEKKLIDSQLLETDIQGKLVCGTINNSVLTDKSLPIITIDDLDENIYDIIDIRENAESILFKDWKILNFKKAPKNIPLTKIVNFFNHVINNENKNKPIALLCSTGNRSLAIAKSLRRIGIKNVWSISGGLALTRLKYENSINY